MHTGLDLYMFDTHARIHDASASVLTKEWAWHHSTLYQRYVTEMRHETFDAQRARKGLVNKLRLEAAASGDEERRLTYELAEQRLLVQELFETSPDAARKRVRSIAEDDPFYKHMAHVLAALRTDLPTLCTAKKGFLTPAEIETQLFATFAPASTALARSFYAAPEIAILEPSGTIRAYRFADSLNDIDLSATDYGTLWTLVDDVGRSFLEETGLMADGEEDPVTSDEDASELASIADYAAMELGQPVILSQDENFSHYLMSRWMAHHVALNVQARPRLMTLSRKRMQEREERAARKADRIMRSFR